MTRDTIYEVEVRVPAWLARLGLAGALLCVLASRTISESMVVNTTHASPSGAYSQLTVTGVAANDGNPVNSVLGPPGTRVAIGAASVPADSATLSVNGAFLLGSNAPLPAAPTMGGTTGAGLYTRGPSSGYSMDTRGSDPAVPARWSLFPWSGSFRMNFTPPAGREREVFRIDAPMMLRNMCRNIQYTYGGAARTSCPAGYFVYGVADNWHPNNSRMFSNVPFGVPDENMNGLAWEAGAGGDLRYIVCCKLLPRLGM